MTTFPALLTVTTTKDNAKKKKLNSLKTHNEMTEGLLAEDQENANDDFFNDRGRLGEQLNAIAPQNQKEEDSSEEYGDKNEDEDDDEERKVPEGGAPLVAATAQPTDKKATGGHPPPRKPDPMYLVYAFIACLCFASGGVIRKFQGDNVLLANAIMTLSFLFAAILHFLYSAIKKRAKGEKYMFPW